MCVCGHNTMWVTISLISFGDFWRSKVLRVPEIASPRPPATGSRPCILWLLFQLLVIKGTIIMTASSVLWWWAAIFPLITPSQSLIYCQPSSPCHAEPQSPAWEAESSPGKWRENIKEAGGETEIGERTFDGSGDDLLLEASGWVGVLSAQYCLKTRKQKNIWWRKRVKYVRFTELNTCTHAGLMFHPTCSNCSNLFSLIIYPQVSCTTVYLTIN